MTVGAAAAADINDHQELRAYLQRGETRLSTAHRVAGAFISGAGLLTLLPVLISNTFSGLLVSVVFYDADGLPIPASGQRWLALIPVLASIGLPLLALYLLIKDLILFYFTARTFKRDNRSTIYPRFILSGIMVSQSSLSDEGRDELEKARQDPYVRDLLVPSPARLRVRILEEAHGVGDLENVTMSLDEALLLNRLREYVLNQTGSHKRSIFEEAAKMEASIARHQRFLRGLVLRYAKAFILTILTTVVTTAANGVLLLMRPVDGKPLPAVNHQYVWLMTLLIYALWALVAALLVRQPINWLYADSTTEKAHRTPQSLLGFERATLAVSMVSALLLAADLWWYAQAEQFVSGAAWFLVLGVCVALAGTGVVAVLGLRSEKLPRGAGAL